MRKTTSIIEEKGEKSDKQTNKHNSVLRSSARLQADGKLKKWHDNSGKKNWKMYVAIVTCF